MTDIDPSAAFSSGGMISISMFATVVNLAGPTGEKRFNTAAWIGRQTSYGTTADHSMFAANTCKKIRG